MSTPTPPDNYADALDTLEASRITRATAQRLHRTSAGVRDPRIPEAERQVSDGLKIAAVHAELATADNLAEINHTLTVGLDGIATRIADVLDLIERGLTAAGVAVDGSIVPGILDVPGPREGEDRA